MRAAWVAPGDVLVADDDRTVTLTTASDWSASEHHVGRSCALVVHVARSETGAGRRWARLLAPTGAGLRLRWACSDHGWTLRRPP